MTMKPAHTETIDGLTLSIYQDEHYDQTPNDEGDDNLFLVNYHRDFDIRRDKVLTENDVRALYGANDDPNEEQITELRKHYHLFPLSMLSHSGVWLSLVHSFECDSGGWDTSHVGLVLAAKSEWPDVDKATRAAESLIENWNDVLQGNVWGYDLTTPDGEHLDSCWGFVGDMEYCLSEARASAAYFVKQRRQRAQARRKAQIRHHVPLDKRA